MIVMKFAVFLCPILSANDAIGYCSTKFPMPMVMGSINARFIMASSVLETNTGNKLISAISTKPTKIQAVAIVGAFDIRNRGDLIRLSIPPNDCFFIRRKGRTEMTSIAPIRKNGKMLRNPVLQMIIGPVENPRAIDRT